MTETKELDNKKLGLARPGKLELKKTVETGQVRQNFSHGRSKMVTVEVRKKRTYERDAGGRMTKVSEMAQALAEDEAELIEEVFEAPDPRTDNLTNEERAARLKALEDARKDGESVPTPRVQQTGPRIADSGEDEEEVEAVADAEAPADVEEDNEEERLRQEQAAAEAAIAKPQRRDVEAIDSDDDEGARGRRKVKTDQKRVTPGPRRDERRRRSGKLTIAEAESLEVEEERQRSLASVKRAREREKQKQQELRQEGHKVVRDVVVPESISVQDLSNRMAERASDVIKVLMRMDMMVTINEVLDADTAELVVNEFGHNIRRVSEADVEIGIKSTEDEPGNLEARAPIVTVMGHVDHGKTSLLDALRQSDVAAHEAGGITQHIGAYQVTTADGSRVTFIDTPGHAAFTEMRARGASVTDIVVLTVAADDGIMPQTIEAIDHAKAAGVPMIVAINKIDRPDANPGKVRTDLLQHDVQVEEMGGDILSVEVSALEKINLDKLMEAITLQAELLDLKANADRAGEGVIVEAKVEQGRGSVATCLMTNGTLRVGDIFVAGSESGRVRALIDSHGNQIDAAGPSTPVEVLGLTGTPKAGDDLIAVDSENKAREVAEFRRRRDRDARASAASRGTLEQMFEKIKEGEVHTLPVIVKADVHGSLEAIVGALGKIGSDDAEIQVLHSGVGGINESDITLARASDAVVIGFNVRANPQARDMSRRDGVDIRYYSIIYNLTDDLTQVLTGMLAPTLKENMLGYATIREVFNISKVGRVAGCMVTEGMIKRGAKVRLLRDDVVIHEGDLGQLKRFKEDAREVKEGTECGMSFANYQDIQVGDLIECFEVEEVARVL